MKVKTIELVKREVEVDIQLPLFRKHDLTGDYDESIIYTRIDAFGGKLRAIDVHIEGDDKVSIEVDNDYSFRSAGTADYTLALGQYKSSRAEFEMAIAQASKLLAVAAATN